MNRPTLETPRLRLRPFHSGDIDDVTRLANDEELSRYIPAIPHPYPRQAAAEWLATHQEKFSFGQELVLAVTEKTDGTLVGAVGLILTPEHRRAELGYWIGRRFWGRGYATEAGKAMLEYGFEVIGLETIFANHLAPNTASGRVMLKLGMKYHGTRPRYYLHRGQFYDAAMYGIVRDEFRR
jgi:RimJ/RimL family protein N-acetyltransferase